MIKEQAEELKAKAQEIERNMGLRKFGDCPVCDDMINKNGGCVYCDWNDKLSPEETCKMFNNHWKAGRVKPGYERPAKKPEDFMVINK